MGVCIVPDIFQEKMRTLMENFEFVSVYLDFFHNYIRLIKGALSQGQGGHEATPIG